MDIKLTSSLSEEEREHLFFWRERVFPVEGKDLEWAKSERHILAYDNESLPIGHIGFAGFDIKTCDGHVVRVVGVGGVVVRPEYQGKQVPLHMFNYLHESDDASVISNIYTLFCPHRLESYYQRHGYQRYNDTVSFLQGQTPTQTDKFLFMYRGAALESGGLSLSSLPW